MSKNISFRADMARKVLWGQKTQARHVITPAWARCLDLDDPEDRAKAIEQAPYKVGDVLWLREPLLIVAACERNDFREVRVQYDADGADGRPTKWTEYPRRLADPKPGKRVPYGCPREFSRASVRVTHVRVERVAGINAADALAEGIDVYRGRDGGADSYRNYSNGDGYCTSPIASFFTLWDSLHAHRGGGVRSNPYVFAYTFRLLTANDINQAKETSA